MIECWFRDFFRDRVFDDFFLCDWSRIWLAGFNHQCRRFHFYGRRFQHSGDGHGRGQYDGSDKCNDFHGSFSFSLDITNPSTPKSIGNGRVLS